MDTGGFYFSGEQYRQRRGASPAQRHFGLSLLFIPHLKGHYSLMMLVRNLQNDWPGQKYEHDEVMSLLQYVPHRQIFLDSPYLLFQAKAARVLALEFQKCAVFWQEAMLFITL